MLNPSAPPWFMYGSLYGLYCRQFCIWYRFCLCTTSKNHSKSPHPSILGSSLVRVSAVALLFE